jgi:hypothetical protein
LNEAGIHREGEQAMHKYFIYGAYGWLTLAGTLHFIIDVVSQYLRGKRAPGPETTLFYGMNTAYALGQVLFGLFGLLVARYSLTLLDQWPARSLAFTAAACWLSFSFVFLEYREPKLIGVVFAALLLGAAFTN